MRGAKIKKVIGVILVIVIIVACAFGLWHFLTREPSDNPIQTPAPTKSVTLPTPTPELKTSFLFRDGVLGKNEEDVCEVLDIEKDEEISENIFSTNMTTTYKWKSSSLEAIYSTVEVVDGVDYDYARNHQVFVDGIIDSTGTEPVVSQELWKDSQTRKFSSNTWNTALKNSELVLYDRFDTEEGSILIITSSKKYDEAIERSRTERIFQTVIVSSKEYMDNLTKDIKI